MSRLKLAEIVRIVRDAGSLTHGYRDVNVALQKAPKVRVWDEFFDFQKEHIRNVMCKAKARDSAIVYGAGNCVDFDLEALADYFVKVVLVDIEEDAVSQARGKLSAKLREKVDIELVDASSCLDSLIVPAGHFISSNYGPQASLRNMFELVNLANDVEITGGERFDFVLSTNLAPTLSLVPIAYLYAKFCDTFRELNVDFDAFEKLFLPYLSASFLFHLVKLSSHFDSETLGLITSATVESPILLRNNNAVPAYYKIDPTTGQKEYILRGAFGPDLSNREVPLLQRHAIEISAPTTLFGVTGFREVFVLEAEKSPVVSGGTLYDGVRCEMSTIGKFKVGAKIYYDEAVQFVII